MPNLGAVLKDEIRRLARKEIRAAVAGLRKDNAALKRTAADHKRRLAALERENRRLVAEAQARRERAIKPTKTELTRARITGRAVRATRKKLRLSQADFAKLLGVTGNSVYQWERKEGSLRLRERTRAAFVEARKLGVRQARKRLEAAES